MHTVLRASCSQLFINKNLLCGFKLVVSTFNTHGNMIFFLFLLAIKSELLHPKQFFALHPSASLSVFHLRINIPFRVSVCGLPLNVCFVLTTAERL